MLRLTCPRIAYHSSYDLIIEEELLDIEINCQSGNWYRLSPLWHCTDFGGWMISFWGPGEECVFLVHCRIAAFPTSTHQMPLALLRPSQGFPHNSVGKESSCNAGDHPGLIPGSGRSTGEGIGYLLQHSWASLVAQLVKISCLHCFHGRSWICTETNIKSHLLSRFNSHTINKSFLWCHVFHVSLLYFLVISLDLQV